MRLNSNDNTALCPITTHSERLFNFDFPSVHIGIGQYPEGPTGCTVFYFPNRARFAVDVRGGSPGVLLLSQWESGERFVDSICFAGGSVYGFEAISGIYSELFAKRDFSVDSKSLGSVIGAILYDFGCRDNAIYPDAELARAAFKAAVPNQFPVGRVGAGSSASVGKLIAPDSWEFAGQGGAFRQLGLTKIAVFSVVNACGAICDRTGNIVRGNLDRVTGKRVPFSEKLLGEKTLGEGENTTLTVLVTNQKLNPFGLRQLGKQVHSSMASALTC